VNADSMLNFPDFRSYEKAFQMITQVRGRAGRGNKVGKVIIQTSHPKHLVIEHVINKDMEGLYQLILSEREQFHYPPFTRLIEVTVVSKDLNEVSHLAQELVLLLQRTFAGKVLGPEFPLVSRIRNFYHKRLLIKVSRNDTPQNVRQALKESLDDLAEKYKKWNYKINIDVDPV
jgi:primosomal protein N' (replication factor Y)